MLDYVFVKLGIPTEIIQHPIVMTESLCTPRHSRTSAFILHSPS